MPAQVTNYKCPACGGTIHYDGALGKLKCDYCESVFEVAEIEALYAQKEEAAQNAFHQAEQAAASGGASEWDTSGMGGGWGADAENMRAYNCPSCGAELICDATTAATSCPYCGNPTVVPGQFGGTLKPDYVIPFKLDKNAAVAALKKHYQKKRFLPKSFTDENHIQELKGIYVPFWLFDGVADANVVFEGTRSHSRRHGNEEITTTEHFRVHRAGSLAFERVPVDGSTKMPDDHMDSIEPFDYSDLKPFSTAYLPGYLADKYDVSAEESAPRADERCANSAVEALQQTVVGYQTCTMLSKNVRLQKGKVHYALMPVWMLTTKWKDKDFLFAMNGQTGKLVGDLPVSWGKFWGTFAAIAAPLSVIASIVAVLLF